MPKIRNKKLFSTSHTTSVGMVDDAQWYISAMERLLQVVQELSQAKDIASVTKIVKHAARELTGANGATLVLRQGDKCYYLDENVTEPLWKGQHFPIDECICNKVMLDAKPVIIEDVCNDSCLSVDVYSSTLVKSLLMVPIGREKPIGAIGNFWSKKHRPTKEEVRILQALADTTSTALENAKLYEHMKSQVEIIQDREAQIRKQHETLEIFTHALAHDLKEPARTLYAFSDMIMQEGKLPEKIKGYFQHVYSASRRLHTLIESVFQYMQLEKEKKITKKRCSSNLLLKEVLSYLNQSIEMHKAKIIYGELPDVYVNPEQLKIIFTNLIQNALEHNKEQVCVEISAEKNKNTWQFSVKDNGVGIDKKQINNIFLPFKYLNYGSKGVGLGLAICAKIIKLHGGEIWCDSKVGKGATIHFTLPAKQPKNKESFPSIQKESNLVLANESPLANILLVDDLDSDIELMQIMFKRSNIHCNLFEARGGREALDFLRQKHMENDLIDLILLDINMPDMNGFEALKLIRSDQAFQKTSVLMCSGSTYQKDLEQASKLGAVGYVIKPVKREKLQEAIEKIPHLHIYEWEEGYTILRKT